jgi:hypothetical protein
MTQATLFKPERTVKAKAADYDRRNIETARLILADPGLHGGLEAFASIWAKTVIARLDPEAAA